MVKFPLRAFFLWQFIACAGQGNTAYAEDIITCDATFREMIIQQDFGLAYYCSGAVLAQNPTDSQAQLVFARAAQELGQWEIAADYSKRSRENALSQENRFASYLISGLAEAGLGNYILSKFYLRRGMDLAQNEVEEKVIRTTLSQVQALSPWRVGLRLNVDPSSNINSGSRNDTMTWLGLEFPLDADAQAQAGVGYTLSGDITHQNRISERVVWENMLSFRGTAYDGRGRNDINLSAQSGLKYAPPSEEKASWHGYVSYEKRYISTALGAGVFDKYIPYTHQTTVSLEYARSQNTDASWAVYSTYTWRVSDVSPLLDAQIAKVGGRYNYTISEEIGLQISGYYEDIASNSVDTAATSFNASLSAVWELPNAPFVLLGKLQYIKTDYKARVFGFADIRHDDVVSLELAITPQNLQFLGFNPSFGIEASHGFSSLDRYETERIKLFTRISSVF